MRTLLSHDATARSSAVGEKERSDMLSSGGKFRTTSLEISPGVLLWAAALVALVAPKRVDIVPEVEPLPSIASIG